MKTCVNCLKCNHEQRFHSIFFWDATFVYLVPIRVAYLCVLIRPLLISSFGLFILLIRSIQRNKIIHLTLLLIHDVPLFSCFQYMNIIEKTNNNQSQNEKNSNIQSNNEEIQIKIVPNKFIGSFWTRFSINFDIVIPIFGFFYCWTTSKWLRKRKKVKKSNFINGKRFVNFALNYWYNSSTKIESILFLFFVFLGVVRLINWIIDL